jgi:tRNA threonylcarbamoyladenosine biosynthesis protein TsaB
MATTLAIDTASPSPAVALAVGDEVFEQALPSDRRASENLLPAIERVLAGAGRRLADCERLGVCSGPGSFTGLRIGIATAWGLSRVFGAPVESVSTLEAMAEAARPFGAADVLCALDAGRGEASVALYDLRAERAREVSPARLFPHGHIPAAAVATLLIALPEGLIPGAQAPATSPARALALALARAPRAAAKSLSPIYSRPSAAEEKRGPAPA